MEKNKPLLSYTPLKLRDLVIKNRFIMPPMCQYSAIEGLVQDWHYRHYTERALGGVGLIIVEATAVEPEGRISPADLGLWNEQHTEAFTRLTEAVHKAGSKISIQLAHAGRKASTQIPWLGDGGVADTQGGWTPLSPGDEAFNQIYRKPRALSEKEIQTEVQAFALAAQRAVKAGFDSVEIHAAHGYLIHQFLSPLTNHRTDTYGGSPENRRRFLKEIIQAVRQVIPSGMPLMVRLSATDWVDEGLKVEDTVSTLKEMIPLGVDFADISSGGLIPGVKIPLGPGYQVALADQVKGQTALATGAVGLITDLELSESILQKKQADAILLGRLLLRDPYWVARNAPAEVRNVPVQYIRGFQ